MSSCWFFGPNLCSRNALGTNRTLEVEPERTRTCTVSSLPGTRRVVVACLPSGWSNDRALKNYPVGERYVTPSTLPNLFVRANLVLDAIRL